MKISAYAGAASELSRGLLGNAALALWGGIDPTREDEFNDWYTHEHIPERIAIPGFLRARRYVADHEDPRLAGWRYFTLYEVNTSEVLHSDAYIAALNSPTAGTLRSLPLFRNMSRMGCTVTYSVARGEGGSLFVAELGPSPGRESEFRAWLTTRAAEDLLIRSGSLAVHLCELDDSATRLGVQVESYRDVRTGTGRWLWLAEGAWTEPMKAVNTCLDTLSARAANGGDERLAAGMFRFLGSATAAKTIV